MSWLARSIANSLRIDDDEGAENDVAPNPTNLDSSPTARQEIVSKDGHQTQSSSGFEENGAQSRGVKEDLTELGETLSRQLWGVASFLAPPPESQDRQPYSRQNFDESEFSDQSEKEDTMDSEMSGRLRGGVSETSEVDSNHLWLRSGENGGENREENVEEEEEEELNAVGITDEVLAFARNISHHPETWLDFPLDEEEDLDDFDMSAAQKSHALVIQHLAPRLAALRIELCPCHMSENYFWKVYFVLLHSRLNKYDAEILSTLQVMKARSMWMQELQKQTKAETDWFGRSTSYMKDSANLPHEDQVPTSSYYTTSDVMSPRTHASEPTTSSTTTDFEFDKHLIESNETRFVDKAVTDEKPVARNKSVFSSKIQIPNYEEDDDDDWPEEDSDFGGHGETTICVGYEDDISFSDLEDDGNLPVKPKVV